MQNIENVEEAGRLQQVTLHYLFQLVFIDDHPQRRSAKKALNMVNE